MKSMITCFLASLLLLGHLSSRPAQAQEFQGPFSSWANVKNTQYAGGAKGDGITDDTAAFQSALNALKPGGPAVLFVPIGTYKITGTLSVTGQVNTSGMDSIVVQGEDPAKTILKWGGAAGGTMITINGVAWGRWSRMTLDGQNTAYLLIDQSWDGTTGRGDTMNEYSDITFTNTQVGFQAGALNNYGAEISFLRDTFSNCSHIGLIPRNFNALDWWVRYCTFKNCYVGVGDYAVNPDGSTLEGGAGAFHVRNSNFFNSASADIEIGNTAPWFSVRDCFSSGSNRFLHTSPNPACPFNLQNNTIINTKQADAIQINDTGPAFVVDNQILSLPANTGAAVYCSGDVLGVGNKFTVSSGFSIAGRSRLLNNATVAAGSISTTPPTLPAAPARQNRPVMEVTSFTGAAIQAAITKAVSSYSGQHPIVHLPVGTYTVSSTITIPANADVQLVGDVEGQTVLNWSGDRSSPLLLLAGPSKAVLREFLVHGPSMSLCVTNANQVGARLFGQGCTAIESYDGIVNNGNNNLNLNLEDQSAGGQHVAIVALGSKTGTGTGRTAVFDAAMGGPQAFYFQDDVTALIEDAWFEWGNADYRGYVSAAGPAGYSGNITINGFEVGLTGNANTSLYPPVHVTDFPGNITLLTAGIGNALTEKIIMDGTSANSILLGSCLTLYDTASFQNKSSSGQMFGLLNLSNTGSPLGDLGSLSDAALLTALASVRTHKPEPQPLAATGTGVTDLQFFRVLLQDGNRESSSDLAIWPGNPPAPTASGLVTNGDFETGTEVSWSLYNCGVVAGRGDAHSGNYAVMMPGPTCGPDQVITGLSPNTTYTATAYLKADTTSDGAFLYANSYGGTEVDSPKITSFGYTQTSITFKTGASNTSVDLGVWKPTGAGNAYADDIALTAGTGGSQDSLTSVSGPTTVTPGQTVKVNVGYTAAGARDIYAEFWSADWTTKYVSKFVTVGAGSGTAAVSITIPSTVAPGSGYHYDCYEVVSGTAWYQGVPEKYQDNITVASATTTYSFNDVTGSNYPLNGIHSGIDFGSGQWLGEAGTYAGLTNYGVFSAAVTSRTFTLPSGKYLKSIQVSGDSGGTYSISDGTHTAKTGSIVNFSPITINTGWASGGTTITVTFSSSWSSQIDNITY